MVCISSEPRPGSRKGNAAPGRAPEGKSTGVDAPPAIRFDGVSKRFGRQRGLERLSLCVAAGESLALVGLNGAGKSTCIKGLLDLCDLDSGAIEIFGAPHAGSRARSRIAFLPERFLPPWYLDGGQFLRYMARLYGVPWREERVREICAQLEIDREALTRPARDLSMGTSQKLGLAAAFLSGRDLLVFDEPMSGLDPKACRLVRRLLDAHRAVGGTLFFSTHAIEELPRYCDRIAVLHAGAIVFVGTSGDCIRRFGGPSLVDACLRCVEFASAHPS